MKLLSAQPTGTRLRAITSPSEQNRWLIAHLLLQVLATFLRIE